MFEILIPIVLVVGVGVGVYFLVFRKKSSSPTSAPVPVPSTGPDGLWHIDFSTGMPPVLTDNQSFVFPAAPNSIHCVETAPIWPGRSSMSMSYHIEPDVTASAPPSFVSTQDPTQPGFVTMYIQRAGDNLSGAGSYASYRFYYQPQSTLLAAGDYTMSAVFDDGWTNVLGQVDAAGLQACLANLGNVGFVFGNPGIGATAHGVQVQGGNATFTLTGFTLT